VCVGVGVEVLEVCLEGFGGVCFGGVRVCVRLEVLEVCVFGGVCVWRCVCGCC
jgi:hypothetical protein